MARGGLPALAIALGTAVVALSGTSYGLLRQADDGLIPWQEATPASRGMDAAALADLAAALATHDTEAFLVVRRGAIVHEHYALLHRDLLTPPRARRYDTASMAKALVGGMALLVALCDGRLDPDEPAWRYIPSWRDHPLKSEITLRHLATHSAGLDHDHPPAGTDWKKRYRHDPAARAEIALTEAPLLFPPGSALRYSDPGFSALAYALAASLRGAPQADLRALLRARIMEPLGIPPAAWSINYGEGAREVDGLRLYEIGGGGRYTARAIARVGQLMLNRGQWRGRQIVAPACVEAAGADAGTALPEDWRGARHPAPALGWWTNANGAWPALPRDTLVGAGRGHQVVVVIPGLDLIAVRLGQPLGEAAFGGDYWIALERELLRPLVGAVAAAPPATSDEDSLAAAD